jgi:endo-1,4-beta-D-glucanase Y
MRPGLRLPGAPRPVGVPRWAPVWALVLVLGCIPAACGLAWGAVRGEASAGADAFAPGAGYAGAAQPAPAAQWPMWHAYAARFISPEGRVMDPDRGFMTTSEGQSYAMFFALVANDPDMFELLRKWTDDNLAQGSLGPKTASWSWGRNSDGSWGILDPNSASDADLWLAYDLLQAGALWNRAAYTSEGRAMLRRIAETEVKELPGLGPVLMPGPQGFALDVNVWLLNPSYMPPMLINAAKQEDAGGPWGRMAQGLPKLLERMSRNGFAMDWVAYSDKGTFTPAHGPGDDPKPPQGSYDAIRMYLWLGIGSSANPARNGLLHFFQGMARELRMHPLPPETIDAEGMAHGDAPLGFSAALEPFLWSLHENFLAAEQQRRVQAGIDPGTGLVGNPPRYYDQNLALFASGWQEKRFRFLGDGMLRVPWKS